MVDGYIKDGSFSRMSEDRGIGLKDWIAGQKSKSSRVENKVEGISLPKNRVAVLPLAHISSDPSDEYFSDGMTEELISTLANVSGLQVISRTSIMQYKNTNKKAVEIGRDLAAGCIIEGSIRKAGNRLRISVQLIDTQEDRHLWAQTYDRELKDVFAIQSDIATKVTEALRIKLLPRDSAQLQKSPTNSTEAYTEYLRGRFHWNKRSKEGLEKAIELFQSAITHDPNYAPAYAGLADCYNVAADWGYLEAKVAHPKARKAALKALELNSNLAEAHASLAVTLQAGWKWEAAEAEFKRAIELNPNYAPARQWYAILLPSLGRAEEALEEARKASELDPLSAVITAHVGWRLVELGRYDTSMEQFKKALEIQPDLATARAGLAAAYAKKSLCDEAIAECRKIDSPAFSGSYMKLQLAYIYAICGRRDEARNLLQEQMKNLEVGKPHLFIAMVYSALGDKDEAIKLLQDVYKSHNPFAYSISLMDLDNLRTDPRFIRLLEKMGIRRWVTPP